MSAAARSAAGANLSRLMRGDEIGEHLVHALYLAQAEQDYIARNVPPAAAEQLAVADLKRELAR